MKVIIEDNNQKSTEENQDDGLLAKTMKMAYGAVKNKLVSILTGNQVLNSIGTVLDILGFLKVIDKDKTEKDLNRISGTLKSGVDNMDELLAKVPLLEDMFGSEKETLNKVLRFMIFAQQISIGAYPAEKYNLANVVAVQSTLLALIVLNVVTGGVLITATFGIGLDLMCSAYNKVYELVQGDIDEFEKWMKENKVDSARIMADLKKGKVQKGKAKKGDKERKKDGDEAKMAAESEYRQIRWRRIDEGLLSGLVKAGAKALGKAFGKGAAKAAAKGAVKTTAKQGAKTTLGRLAGRLAPGVVKAGRRISAAALKQLRKSSPDLARFVRNGGHAVVSACSKSGLTTYMALSIAGDFLQQAWERADEEDRKVIEVMKEELKGEKTSEEISNKLEAMFAVIADEDDVQIESTHKVRWLRIR